MTHKKCFLLLLLGLFICRPALAQYEFLAKINTVSGVYTQIHHLPGVNWISVCPRYSSYDENNHRYFFQGIDTAGLHFFYTVDAPTGTITNQVSFPNLPGPGDNIIELHYNNANNTLYGLHWDASDSMEYLVTLDPLSGQMTLVDSIPEIEYIVVSPNYVCIDEIHGRYLCYAYDRNGYSHLYSIDLATGAVVSSPVFPSTIPGDRLMEFQFDNSSGNLYSLFWDYSDSTMNMATVDPATGLHTLLFTIPGLTSVPDNPHYITFDENNHRYIFQGYDSLYQSRLYSVNVLSGATVYQPVFPVLFNPGDNVIEFEFDNVDSILYALNWDNKSNISTGVQEAQGLKNNYTLYPNPFHSQLHLVFEKEYEDIYMVMYNSSGSAVRTYRSSRAASMVIDRGDLSAGVYQLFVYCGHQIAGSSRIIIE
jgi:hypothetical protein